jgi:hypothetical protein
MWKNAFKFAFNLNSCHYAEEETTRHRLEQIQRHRQDAEAGRCRSQTLNSIKR